MQISMDVDFNALGTLERGLRRETKKAIRDFGRKIVEYAQDNARKRTGAYAASIYMKTDLVNGYYKAVSTASALNPQAEFFDDIPAVTDELSVMFAIAVKYGLYVHDGTATRPPNPVLFEAMHIYYDEYVKVVAEALDKGLKEETRNYSAYRRFANR